MVLRQQIPVFLLESHLPVMFLLVINISNEVLHLAPAHGKSSVTSLPEEFGILIALVFDPTRRGLFDLFQQACLAAGAGQTHSQVNVVLYAPDSVSFTVTIPAEGCQIRMHARPDTDIQPWAAFLGAENEVQNNLAEGLRHGGCKKGFSDVSGSDLMKQALWPARRNTTLQPRAALRFALGWYETGPWPGVPEQIPT
jgi:hypothetical protein